MLSESASATCTTLALILVSRLGWQPARPEVGELGHARWRDPRRCLAAVCRGAFGGMPGRSRPAVYPYRAAGTVAGWNPAYRDRVPARYVSDFTVFEEMGVAPGQGQRPAQGRSSGVRLGEGPVRVRRLPIP